MKSQNNVILKGEIVYIYSTSKMTAVSLRVITERLNFPNVLFFGELKGEVSSNYSVGDFVAIEGNIQSQKRNPEIAHQKPAAIFGEKIYKITKLDAEFENNRFSLSGVLVNVSKDYDNLISFTVLTMKNGWLSIIRCNHYTFYPDELMSKFEKGQDVIVTGQVQTVKRIKPDTTMHYQNYVAQHISLSIGSEVA